MESLKNKKILISGASIAGLSTAYCLSRLGYQVTVVELAAQPRTAGAAIDLRGPAIDAVRHLGIFERLKFHGLHVEKIEFKNANNITEGSILIDGDADTDEIEIERDKFIGILFEDLKSDVEFMFNNSIAALHEMDDDIQVTFKNGVQRTYDLVVGCDGSHSGVRKLWFGPEADYAHFLEAYFSITIVEKLLVTQKTMHMYNVPGKGIMLNAYNNKTDVIFCFLSEKEISYDYRDTAQQRKIISDEFEAQGWRTEELLTELAHSDNFYFDKFCQIKMPSWTKGRVALVGDAG